MRSFHVLTNQVLTPSTLCLLTVLASPFAGTTATAQQQAGGERRAAKNPGSIDVVVRGRLAANVMAIGGETTGTTVTANGIELELDLQNRRRLRRLAEQLDGSRVLVEGALFQRAGVERGKRLVIRVDRIEGLRSVAVPRRGNRARDAGGNRDMTDDREGRGALAPEDRPLDQQRDPDLRDRLPGEPGEWDPDNAIHVDIGDILRDALRRFPE